MTHCQFLTSWLRPGYAKGLTVYGKSATPQEKQNGFVELKVEWAPWPLWDPPPLDTQARRLVLFLRIFVLIIKQKYGYRCMMKWGRNPRSERLMSIDSGTFDQLMRQQVTCHIQHIQHPQQKWEFYERDWVIPSVFAFSILTCICVYLVKYLFILHLTNPSCL